MNTALLFPEVHGVLGFGCLHLPQKDGQVDYEEFSRMADAFIASGMNYFDTAHGYVGGQSEIAIRDCVVRRYARSQFLLADKLTDAFFQKQEDILPLFEQQLGWCGVDYFDFYLMHAQDQRRYQKFKRCKAYETCYALKKEGLIRHLGISFHDKADVLDVILSEHPEVEFVQIQFNYMDYDDTTVEARKVYTVCEKHGKPVIVMEPIKGGSLVKLPQKADAVLRELNGGGNAGYALRFAASFPNIMTVLSGMSNMAQMEENLEVMRYHKPLSREEHEAIREVCRIIRSMNLIPCTSCRYCVEENECPKGIRIPEMFSSLNAHDAFHNWNTSYYYSNAVTGEGHGKASECIRCGKCEKVCPQHLPIRELLKKVAQRFEIDALTEEHP